MGRAGPGRRWGRCFTTSLGRVNPEESTKGRKALRPGRAPVKNPNWIRGYNKFASSVNVSTVRFYFNPDFPDNR